MILLDTNVISEALKPIPAPPVVAWLNRQTVAALFMPTPVLAELMTGLAFMPKGRRRNDVTDQVNRFIETIFAGRFVTFDEPAAREYASIMAEARAEGRAIAVMDGQIAAIARSRNFAVATRDRSPFDAAGVAVIDPWLA